MKRHEGTIHFKTEPGKGTDFVVMLPYVRAAATEPEGGRRISLPAVRGGGLTILLVEDEPAVRRIGLRLLDSLGHRAIEAIDGHSGLAKWREYKDEIDPVVTDMVMPGGMSGLQLAEMISPTSRPCPSSLRADTRTRCCSTSSFSSIPCADFCRNPTTGPRCARRSPACPHARMPAVHDRSTSPTSSGLPV